MSYYDTSNDLSDSLHLLSKDLQLDCEFQNNQAFGVDNICVDLQVSEINPDKEIDTNQTNFNVFSFSSFRNFEISSENSFNIPEIITNCVQSSIIGSVIVDCFNNNFTLTFTLNNEFSELFNNSIPNFTQHGDNEQTTQSINQSDGTNASCSKENKNKSNNISNKLGAEQGAGGGENPDDKFWFKKIVEDYIHLNWEQELIMRILRYLFNENRQPVSYQFIMRLLQALETIYATSLPSNFPYCAEYREHTSTRRGTTKRFMWVCDTSNMATGTGYLYTSHNINLDFVLDQSPSAITYMQNATSNTYDTSSFSCSNSNTLNDATGITPVTPHQATSNFQPTLAVWNGTQTSAQPISLDLMNLLLQSSQVAQLSQALHHQSIQHQNMQHQNMQLGLPQGITNVTNISANPSVLNNNETNTAIQANIQQDLPVTNPDNHNHTNIMGQILNHFALFGMTFIVIQGGAYLTSSGSRKKNKINTRSLEERGRQRGKSDFYNLTQQQGYKFGNFTWDSVPTISPVPSRPHVSYADQQKESYLEALQEGRETALDTYSGQNPRYSSRMRKAVNENSSLMTPYNNQNNGNNSDPLSGPIGVIASVLVSILLNSTGRIDISNLYRILRRRNNQD